MNSTIKLVILILFSAISIISCTVGVKDHDGNIYKTIKIGNQEWLAENLNVSCFRNGEIINEAKSPEDWIMTGKEGKPAWCIPKDMDNGSNNGKFYNWYAVNDPRGLAPEGWHVASDADWKELTDFLGGEISAAFGIRTTGLSGSGSDNIETGFSGIPAGAFAPDGTFYGVGSYAYWWTSTEFTGSEAWIRLLSYVQCSINSKVYKKNSGLSVRCVRDK